MTQDWRIPTVDDTLDDIPFSAAPAVLTVTCCAGCRCRKRGVQPNPIEPQCDNSGCVCHDEETP